MGCGTEYKSPLNRKYKWKPDKVAQAFKTNTGEEEAGRSM